MYNCSEVLLERGDEDKILIMSKSFVYDTIKLDEGDKYRCDISRYIKSKTYCDIIYKYDNGFSVVNLKPSNMNRRGKVISVRKSPSELHYSITFDDSITFISKFYLEVGNTYEYEYEWLDNIRIITDKPNRVSTLN